MANNLGILANKYYFNFKTSKLRMYLNTRYKYSKARPAFPFPYSRAATANSAINKISTLLCRLSGLRGSSLLTPRHTKKIIDLGNCAAPSNSVIQALDNQKLFE